MSTAVIPVVEADAWMRRVMESDASAKAGILAYYDHRLRAITRCPACALVPVDDHLVHRGDGVFETVSFKQRGLIDLDAHLRRLEHSVQGLSLSLPCSLEELRAIVIAVATASGVNDGMLRILVGRGQGGFGLDPAQCPVAGLYVTAYHELEEVGFPSGATAARSSVPVKPAMLAKLKTTNYVLNVLMVIEASRRGVDFVFSFDEDGFLAEAPIANVALVDARGTLVMPEFRNALAGTTAVKTAELAAGFMPVAWRPVPEQDVFEAREILLLGTAHGCLSVVCYEGETIGNGLPGPVADRLRVLLAETLQEERVLF